jgi:hypothetical protein
MKTLLLAGLLAASAAAQMTDVPPVIQLVRKPGTGSLSFKPYADAKAAVEVVGLTSVTGLPETWMIESHPSFVSIEELDKAMAPGRRMLAGQPPSSTSQDDVLMPARTMIATYRPEWSYRPQEAVRMFSRARYFHVSIYRVRPGEDDDLAGLMQLRRSVFESVNLARPDLVYHIISGEPSGVYVILAPLISLKILDDGMAALPAYAEPIAAAEAKEGKKASAVELSREHFLFRVEPRISYVSDEFAAADMEFWRGKRP